MSEAEVLREILRVIGRTEELERLPQAVPFLTRELDIAAVNDVIVDGNDVKRSGVGRGVSVRIIFEPVDKTCALGNFVGNLAVFTLELADKLKCGTSGGKISDRVQGKGSPERITAKIQGVARTL